MTATHEATLQIKRTLVPESARRRLPEDSATLGFGRTFTDHMFGLDYSAESGWHGARVEPYGPLQLDPAALVLHYAQTCFEGQKAFRAADGGVLLFRPDMNAARFARSCERMCIPAVPIESYLAGVQALVDVERAWVPSDPGTALYIRPTIIATEAVLGVRPAKEYLFYVIVSPVGPYFAAGFKPIDLLISDEYVRAVKGGCGEAKTGGNYAASLLAGQRAAAQGFNQVLYLDAIERRFIEEVGAMNMMFVFGGDTVVTPSLDGSILPGITRMCAIQLAREKLGLTVEERPLAVDELVEGIRSGAVTEVFGTGTAAAIAPVGRLQYKGEDYVVNERKVGPVAQGLYDTLQGIQYGRITDEWGWTVRV